MEQGTVMRWFTCEWQRGDLTDDEYDAAFPNYFEHVAVIRDNLAPDAAAILDLDLHDGQVQEWSYKDKVFSWRMLIGDLQCGYQLATMTYSNADLLGVDAAKLTTFGLTGKEVELLMDEVDVATDGRTEHRFLFWPLNEFGLRFSQVSVELVPASGDLRR